MTKFSTNLFQINLLQRHSFQWFHENELPLESMSPVRPTRPHLMSELRNSVNAMITSHDDLAKSQAKFQVDKANFL
jgi:hypothetical protein